METSDTSIAAPNRTMRFAILGLMTALTAVFTILIRIPIAPTRGYLNMGDVAVFFSALAFGPWTAFITGGLGTALADILGGYAQWAPVTFFAHGLQGFFAGLFFLALKKGEENRIQASTLENSETKAGGLKTSRLFFLILGFLTGALAMIGAYFAFAFITMGPGAAVSELPANLIQNAAGIIISLILWSAVRKAYPPITRFRW